MSTDDPGDVHFEVVNQVALLTLDRPRSLNALSHAMVLRLHALLDQVEADTSLRAVVLRGHGPKAFCAGGDVIALAQSVREGGALHRDFFLDEYRLDWRLHTFAKPVVAFMHGIVMGGGMGLAQGASLRLVTDSVRIAMPETRIGLIPDVGATHFFSKMPAPLAAYLALSGAHIGASDALFVNLADARSRVGDPQALPALLADIAWPNQEQVDTLQVLRHTLAAQVDATQLDDAPLLAACPDIFRHFDPAQPLANLVAKLEASQGDWARSTAQALRSHSPLMMALTLLALQRGRRLDLPACLRMEYGLVQQALTCGEFNEGVRAHLIDKDRSPSWAISCVEALSGTVVASAWAAAQHLSRDPLAHRA
jgi:enoyl-CoA hydratase/carnithine racemase